MDSPDLSRESQRPAPPQAADIAKDLSRCLSFCAVVEEVRSVPSAKQEQGAGWSRRRERRKGARTNPLSQPTGEFLWRLSINGAVRVSDSDQGGRMVTAINNAVIEGLQVEIKQALAARELAMKSGPLSVSDYAILQQVHGGIQVLTDPWVRFVHEPQGVVRVQRQTPIQFVGEGAKQRADALAAYVNSVVRPFIDPIQVELQRRLYELMRADYGVNISGFA